MMRYAGGIYIADEPRIWTWAIDAISDHVLAAEPHPVGRWMKGGAFRLLRKPAMRRCLPLRAPDVVDDASTEGVGVIDMLFRRSHKKWISFRVEEGVLTRHFPSHWRWTKERWIRSLPAVAATSPRMLAWDEALCLSQEEYIPGRPVRVHDLDEGLRAWSDLWPLLAKVFMTRTTTRTVRLPKWISQGRASDWLHQMRLEPIIEELKETPVLHGLVHGDLQQSNMLVAKDRFYVIDWGDHFHLGPPLYDLLFYLFKHALSVGPDKVARRALDNPDWIEQGLPGALQPEAIKASLVTFTLMLTRRYQYRSVRRRRRLVRHLQRFIREVGVRLLPSATPYEQLPTVLLQLPDFGAGRGNERNTGLGL